LPATSAAAATTTATPATETTTTAAAAARPLLGLVDRQRPAAELAAVQLVNGLLGLLVAAHLDEREAAGPAGLAVRHHLGIRDGAVLAEHLAQLELGGVERKIADVQTSTHV